MKSRNIVLIVSSILALISIVAMRIHHERLKQPPQSSAVRFADHINQTVAEWKKHTYISLASSNEIEAQISAMLARNADRNLLSKHQHDRLSEVLRDLFDAYSAGTYEAYSRFRFPRGVAWQWKTNGCGYVHNKTDAKTELARYFNEGPVFGGTLFVNNFRTNYGFYPTKKITRPPPEGMDARFKEYVFQYSNRTYYSNYWTGVNFDNSRLILTKGTGQPSPLVKMPFFPVQERKNATVERPFPNLGFSESAVSSASLVEFDNTLSEVLEKNREIFTADVFFYIETSPPDVPLPILMRFYWSPADDRWLPDNLVKCSVKTLLLRYPIF